MNTNSCVKSFPFERELHGKSLRYCKIVDISTSVAKHEHRQLYRACIGSSWDRIKTDTE